MPHAGNISVELWNADGQRLAQALAPATAEGPAFPPNATVDPPKRAGIQPLRAIGDLIYTEHVVEVQADAALHGAAGRGFLVVPAPRRLAGGGAGRRPPDRRRQLAASRVARHRRLDRPGQAPRGAAEDVRQRGRRLPARRRRDLARHRGTASTGTPLVIWAETPESVALGPAHTFWNAMLPIGALFVVLGALLAWVISRRITAPLSDLTAAAEAVAGGDLSRRVRSARSDEVGRLADAFNTMADQVQAGYSRLDTGIKARTAELEQAMTQLHETQEQLVRREKLAMLGQLASGVGHELRNPLGVMTNAVYYLEMIQADAPTDVQEYLGILRAQIGLAEKIVGDLLDFSRIRPPRRDIVAAADVVAAQQARLTVPPGVTVAVDVPAGLPRVSIDSVQIGQILFNLLVNALQALEGRGGTIRVGSSVTDTHVLLHVEDDGPGVPANLRAKIFEPLFTTKARGIGLGLAVSRSLAEANEGTLILEESGPGARFTLSMPRDGIGEAS